MSATKYIIPETASFTDKFLHHKERAKSSQENIPKFTNPLISNIEEVNLTFTFREATIQPEGL